MERVRFTAPVKLGDTIHMEAQIAALEPKDAERGVLTWDSRVLNQRGEPCCVFQTKLLCGRAPGAGDAR